MLSLGRMVSAFDRDDEATPPPDTAPTEPVARPHPAAEEPFAIVVRALAWRDVPRLRSLESLAPLNQPESLVLGFGPLRSAAQAALPWGRAPHPTFVAEAAGRLVGYAEFRALAFDGRWVLAALGASVGVYAADPVWEALLAHATRQAGLRGVKRLYARIPWAVGGGTTCRRLGWHAYATESVFLAHDLALPRPDAWRPRRQQRADTWAVHQLYAATVPREVQEAEALTSHRWDAPRSRRRATAVDGWLFEEGHQLVGYVRTLAAGSQIALEVLVDPDRREGVGAMVDGALGQFGARGLRRVYCAVRGYQSELAGPLTERGFVPAFEQELFVRYTTATARRPVSESVPFALEVREPVPRRVPTFLQLPPEDEPAR